MVLDETFFLNDLAAETGGQVLTAAGAGSDKDGSKGGGVGGVVNTPGGATGGSGRFELFGLSLGSLIVLTVIGFAIFKS